MPDDIPVEIRPRREVTQDPAKTVEILLRQTLRSTRYLIEENSQSPTAVASHASSGVMAWSAYRFLEPHERQPRSSLPRSPPTSRSSSTAERASVPSAARPTLHRR